MQTGKTADSYYIDVIMNNSSQGGASIHHLSYCDAEISHFSYPTVCARIIFCPGRSLNTSASDALSTEPRTTTASPCDAQ